MKEEMEQKFLVIHEYENPDWQTSPEFRACMEHAIDWMERIRITMLSRSDESFSAYMTRYKNQR